jgi:SAM-dependent methyltransferase
MSQALSNSDQVEFWNGDAGQRWVAQQERLDAMLEDIGAAALRAAAVKPDEHVLDIGCGCGKTSLELADIVGAKGRVLGADISAPMLAHAKSRIGARPQLAFMHADASTHRFEPSFDLVFSRFGVMFFADPDVAFANLRKALKPSGRLAFVCWREPRENDWVRIPIAAAREHVPPQPPLGPEDPGPFAFANPGRVRRILANGGFDVITMRPFDTQMPMGDSLDDAVDYLQEFGPVSRLLKEATSRQREGAVKAMREVLAPYAKSLPVKLTAATWLVTAKCG